MFLDLKYQEKRIIHNIRPLANIHGISWRKHQKKQSDYWRIFTIYNNNEYLRNEDGNQINIDWKLFDFILVKLKGDRQYEKREEMTV